MNYRLSQDGREVGSFTLEGLRRLRDTGQLTGEEYVWTEGMAEWKTLDSILPPEPEPLVSKTTTTSSRQSRLKSLLVALAVIAALGMVSVLAVAVWVGHKLHNPPLPPPSKQSAGTVPDRATPKAQYAMEAASKPVAPNPKTKTAADVQASKREFRVRQYIQGYQLRGERAPRCDLLAQQFLTNWIGENFGGALDTNLPPLYQISRQIMTNPACRDPLVLSVVAITSSSRTEEIRCLEKALDAFDSSKHLGYPKFHAAVVLANVLASGEPDRVSALDSQALGYFKAALVDGSILPEDQSNLAETLVNDWGKGFFQRNTATVIAHVHDQGEKFKWLGLVLEGEHEIDEAWRARGQKNASQVTADGWTGFYDHLANAREKLTAAWELAPDRPLAPSAMITVCLGANSTQMRDWFDRATAAQVDYPDAWSKMRWGLRPRWHGSHEAMLALGVTAVNTRRFDTDVPRMFIDCVADIESELGLPRGEHIYGRDDVWPHLKELYEGYIAEPSLTPYAHDGWRGAYMVVAALAGKYDVARQQLEALNMQPHQENLEGWHRDLELLPPEVAARTGVAAGRVTAAEALYQTGDITGALQVYVGLAAATNLDKWTAFFVRERQAALQLEQRLQAGEWADFLPTDTNFTGWHTRLGRFDVKPGGILEVRADQHGHMICARARIGADFEMRGQVEVMSSTSPAFQAGLVMGLPQWDEYAWYAFRMKRDADHADTVEYSRRWNHDATKQPAKLNDLVNSFDFQIRNGLVSATVNGREIFKDMVPEQKYRGNPDELYAGLGADNDSNSTVIRYRKVQIRRLTPQ